MKKFIFSLIVLVGSFSAYAHANLAMEDTLREKHADESKSYYQALGDLFKSGSTPDVKKLVGVAWAGRCFFKKKPNMVTNAGCIFRVDRKTDAGPIGRDKETYKETYKAASYWNLSKALNFYDTMTIDEVSKLVKFDLSKVKSYEGNISFDVNERTRTISELKISGEYLIEEISSKKGEDVGSIKKSAYETSVRCYYFIPDVLHIKKDITPKASMIKPPIHFS